jgi:phosphatidylinositol alpha 1,6-mannosyltransferase
MRVRHGFVVRVAVVTESFLPEVNGVTNSVLRVLEHLQGHGHQALVLAAGRGGPASYAGATVVRALSVPVPRYRSLSIGLPSPRVEAALRLFRPELVHLASPVVLGAHGVAVARRLAVPAVAVYQTDVPAFLGRYGLGVAEPATWRWLHWIHRRADLTLAPSTHTVEALVRHGITGVEVWRRGVDAERFHPRHRSPALRRRLAPGGEVLVGYVGRLAAEKRVGLLAALEGLEGCRVVVVGDGPLRRHLERRLPWVRFLGFRGGQELSEVFASLDVFVHTGADETFCQAAQEALASGVPVVAPAAGGPPDFVHHGDNGYLWHPGDAGQLREAVAALVASPATRAAMGRRARASVVDRTWEAVGDQLLHHYRSVLAGRSPALAAA